MEIIPCLTLFAEIWSVLHCLLTEPPFDCRPARLRPLPPLPPFLASSIPLTSPLPIFQVSKSPTSGIASDIPHLDREVFLNGLIRLQTRRPPRAKPLKCRAMLPNHRRREMQKIRDLHELGIGVLGRHHMALGVHHPLAHRERHDGGVKGARRRPDAAPVLVGAHGAVARRRRGEGLAAAVFPLLPLAKSTLKIKSKIFLSSNLWGSATQYEI
jgi:hypothetical protein